MAKSSLQAHDAPTIHLTKTQIQAADQSARTRHNADQSRGVLLSVLVFVLVFAAALAGLHALGHISSGDSANGAYAYMQQFVKPRLKAPSTAVFEYGGAEHVTRVAEHEYRVASYVDSQNGFGASVRTYFRGTIKYDDGTWTLESLNFD